MGILGLTDSQNYSDIADAIRAKAGTTSTYAPDEMALAIRSISGGGAIILQDKTATPSTAIQTVQYDAGYDGLRKVTVAAIPTDYIIPSGTKQINSNGIVDVAAYKSANVAVPTGGGTATVTQLNITPTESQQTYTALLSGVDGFTPVVVAAVSSTYVGSGVPRRDWGTVTPGLVNQILHSGYWEYDTTVLGDADLVAGNIKKNVQIFGVTGTYEGGGSTPNLQEKTASSSTAKQTITPDSGYDGLSKVTINAMTTGSATTPTKTISVTPSISVNSSNGQISVSVSGSSAITPTVSAGYVSQGTSGTVSVTGSNSQTMTTKAAATITPNTADQTIAANQFLTGAQTIKGDANLVAGNIKKNTQIFGVTGTYEGSGGGGTTNVITGTFTTNSAAGVQSVSLPYTGTGHIIAAHVFVEGGAYNSGNNWYNSVKRYTIAQWMMSKAVTTLAPTFTTSGSANYGCTAWVYKNSTSAPTSYTRSSAMTTNTFTSSTATNAGATCVRFNSNTNMRCYVSATSTYGLLASTQYHYIVTYSS